jgi:hypothetical protein
MLLAQNQTAKLPKYSGTVMADELKVQGGEFTVCDSSGESKTFEYNTPKAPKCTFYDQKSSKPLQPHQIAFGDEVTVAYKQHKNTLYAVKITRTKAAKR